MANEIKIKVSRTGKKATVTTADLQNYSTAIVNFLNAHSDDPKYKDINECEIKISASGKISAELNSLNDKRLGDFLETINPVVEDEARMFAGNEYVQNKTEMADVEKLIKTVDAHINATKTANNMLTKENTTLRAENQELEKANEDYRKANEDISSKYMTDVANLKMSNTTLANRVQEVEEANVELQAKVAQDEEKVQKAEQQTKRYKKSNGVKNIFLGVLTGALILTGIWGVSQTARGNRYKNKASQAEHQITQIENNLGYVEGMTDANGNPISFEQYLEMKKAEFQNLVNEVDGAKELLETLGYLDEQDQNQTLEELIQNMSDALNNQIQNERTEAYAHFVEVLSDLGLSLADIQDENGNISVEQFDQKTATIVQDALSNIEKLENIGNKLDEIFDHLKIEKSEIQTFDAKEDAKDYVTKEDFATYEEAMDFVVQWFDAKKEADDKIIANAIDTAFAELNMNVRASDFENNEQAINYLRIYAKILRADNSAKADEIDKKVEEIDKLEKTNAGLQSELDKTQEDLKTANAEKDRLQKELDELKNGLENTDQKPSSGTSGNNGGTPVAGEENNTDINQGQGTRLPGGNGGGSGKDHGELNNETDSTKTPENNPENNPEENPENNGTELGE